MRPDCGPESFWPRLLEHAQHRRCDLLDRARRVDRHHGPGLWMALLPHWIGESVERIGNPMVEVVVRGFDPIPRPTAIRARQGGRDGQTQQDGKIGYETAGCKLVCRCDLGFREVASGDLVCV